MPTTSDGVIKLIEAGVVFESVDAAGRTTDGLIKIGNALIVRGFKPRFVNCQSTASDSIIKVNAALNGNVTFEGV